MKEYFQEILSISEVQWTIFLTPDGKPVFIEPSSKELADASMWQRLLAEITPINEVDLIYGKKRVYIRNAGSGYIVVIMDRFSNSAMIKLQCDVIIPSLKKMKIKKRIMAQIKNFKL